MFNVGDRVRCIRTVASGNTAFGAVGEIYTVTYASGAAVRLGELNYSCGVERFELAEAPIDNREEITIYVVIYTLTRDNSRKYSISHMTELSANQQAEFVRNSEEYTLLALKKFKTRI